MAAPLAPWDDGKSHTGVQRIKQLSYSKNREAGAIALFQVTYDVNGRSVDGDAHGVTPSGFQTETDIGLNFPKNYISKVYWSIGRSILLPGTDVVRSLTFVLDHGHKIGPFGVEEGTYFEKNIPRNERIVGFKGESGLLLKSIDFHTINI